MEKIVLDANVLFSNGLRRLFLWMSWNGLCEIVWTQELWDEVLRNYSDDPVTAEKFHKHVTEVIFQKFAGSMRALKEYGNIGLPDKDDEHVVALARQEKASHVVTFNLDDFPEELLRKIGIESVHPDPYLCRLYDEMPGEMKSVIQQTIASYTETKPSKGAYFETLRNTKVTEFVERLEDADDDEELFPEVWT